MPLCLIISIVKSHFYIIMDAISICIGRKGSKGLPGKNTMQVRGRPMAFYPMKAALNSKHIKHRFLSTDDEDIKNIGKELNHNLIQRPEELATSKALGEDVFKYTYEKIINERTDLKNLLIVLLFCNAPTVSGPLIDDAIESLNNDPTADSVVTVSKFNMWSPIRARKIGSDKYLEPFIPFEFFGDPKSLNCDRDSQGDVLFANMSLSVVRPKCLIEMHSGLLPQKWMGRKIKPLFQDFGCDVDFIWQVPMVEHWIKENL